jgi:hypothetical protein
MVAQTMDPGPVKVPVLATLGEACHLVFGRVGLFISLAVFPAIAVLALRLTIAPLPHAAGTPVPSGSPWWLQLLVGVASVLIYNVFLVRWHQVALFGKPGSYNSTLFLGGYRRFIAYTLATYSVALAVVIGFGASSLVVAGYSAAGGSRTGSFGTLALVAAVSLAILLVWMMRCALVFPSAAFGQPLGFAEAWRRMRGNAWRFVGASMLVALVMFVVTFVPAFFIGIANGVGKVMAAHSTHAPPSMTFSMSILVARQIVDVMATFIAMALGASTLSAFYRRIVLKSEVPPT